MFTRQHVGGDVIKLAKLKAFCLMQCRQKTVEVKAKCTECTLRWCPRCLLNRYGQVVEEVIL